MYRVYIDVNGTHFFTHAHLPVGEQMWLQSLDPVNAATWTLLALDDLIQALYMCLFRMRAYSHEYDVYNYISFLF